MRETVGYLSNINNMVDKCLLKIDEKELLIWEKQRFDWITVLPLSEMFYN